MALTAKKVYAILKRQIFDMEAKLNSPVRYRGTVATADLLPLNPDIGDMYNIESKSVYGEAGMNVAWNGVVWDTMGAPIDMSLYLTKEEAETVIQRLVTEYFEKNPVKPGATAEQAQQIEQNKKDVASLKTETNSLKESISTKITKFYASSQGETHLADSDNGKIIDMMVYGQSKQAVTTGAQLLGSNTVFVRNTGDISIPTNNPYEVSWTHNTNVPIRGVYLENAEPILANKQYTISFDARFSDGNSHNIRCVDTVKTCVNGRNSILIEIHEKNSTVSFYTLGKITEGLSVAISNIMLEEGSTPHDFEPYTGGQPSPSPDYPQEINSVVNPTVKVCGKNLLKATLQATTVNGVTCTNNGDGTYTLNGSNPNTPNVFVLGTVYLIKDKKYKMTGCPANPGKAYLQLRTPDDVAYKNDYSSGVEFVIPKSGEYIVRIYYDVETYNNLLFKPMIVDASLYPDTTYDDFEPYHEQTATLPYTLNAIPVSSGGNVTIGSQQYISDYFDVERGKLVRMCKEKVFDGTENWRSEQSYMIADIPNFNRIDNNKYMEYLLCDKYKSQTNIGNYDNVIFARKGGDGVVIKDTSHQSTVEDWKKYLNDNPCIVRYLLTSPIEIDLTTEEIAAFKALATYYPTTNISINSEQLDGYTVFNYPISMENGWNYVKQQIGDTREYIYDMDARAQDTDLQAAEAYVNSEYAVALTELEV